MQTDPFQLKGARCLLMSDDLQSDSYQSEQDCGIPLCPLSKSSTSYKIRYTALSQQSISDTRKMVQISLVTD